MQILVIHKAIVGSRAITKILSKTGGSVLPMEKEVQGHAVRLAECTTLQRMSKTPVLVNMAASRIVQIASYTPFAQQYPRIAVCEIMDLSIS